MNNSQKNDSAPDLLKNLWSDGVFDSWKKFGDIMGIIGKRGHHFSNPVLALALKRAVFLTRRGKRGFFEYIQKSPPPSNEGSQLKKQILPKKLFNKLSKGFGIELTDLYWNYSKSGTCTAFLLRKILEKLIFLTFSKNGLDSKLKDTNGRFIGLEKMINLASVEKVQGIHFLMPKTAENIKGIKFLGDTSAHNPLVNVDVQTITPQMPFIITAFEELVAKL